MNFHNISYYASIELFSLFSLYWYPFCFSFLTCRLNNICDRSADLFTRSCIQLTGSIHSLLPQFLSLRVTLILCSVLGSSQSSHPPHLISQIVLKDVLCKQISIYILNICKSDETCTFCFIFR